MIPRAVTVSPWRPRLRAVWRYYAYEVIATAGAALAISAAIGLAMSLVACQTVKDVGGEIGGTAAEWIACPTDIVPCGHVFQCYGTAAATPSGYVEVCIDDDDQPEQVDGIEAAFGLCEPTPRHQGLCFWHCDGGRGCNAFSGCWGCP
jgi:hypothetical protein